MGLLYERHKRRLFGYFYHMNGDPALCEDLVQNTFLRLLRYRKSYSGTGSFVSWMLRTARNLQVDQYKRTARNPERPSVDRDLERAAGREDTGYTEGDSRLIALQRALRSLPADSREVLLMSKIRGMTYSDIGATLGCSEGAAKVRAHRALNTLREIMLSAND